MLRLLSDIFPMLILYSWRTFRLLSPVLGGLISIMTVKAYWCHLFHEVYCSCATCRSYMLCGLCHVVYQKKFLFVWRERKPTRCYNQMFIINFCLNMFRASICPSSGEQRPCVTAYGVLRWFCWMWLVAVVGRCVVGYNAAPHNRYQPHPAEPALCTYALTHGLCSSEDGRNDTRNMLRQKLTINIWLLHLVGFLSHFTLCSRCTVTGN